MSGDFEYRIPYTKIPTAYNNTRVAFVMANTPQGALAKLRNQVERQLGEQASDFVWGTPKRTTEEQTCEPTKKAT